MSGVIAIIGSCVSVSFGMPPCTCTRRISPVCGSDGNTYNNQCLLECAAIKNPDITLARSGKCDSRVKRDEPLLCPCNAINLPVCGTDGETYANECILNCQKEQTNVELKHEGPCKVKREEPVCACTFDFSPVCGTDGGEQKTYSNKCDLECTQRTRAVEFLHSGPCRVKRDEIQVAPGPICLCTADLRPVCASNGLTYDNKCLFNCAKDLSTLNELHIEYEGQCAPKPAVVGDGGPKCSCPKVTEPVCASDGRTYSNECMMNCEAKELTIAHNGPCSD